MHEEAPETIRTLADGCARFVHRAVWIELDGTPDTLPILDHYVSLVREDEARDRQEVLGLIATSAGAYFGEVVRRALPNARWHAPDEDPTRWRIEFEHVFLSFNPVGLVRETILQQQEEGWNAHLETLPSERAALSRAYERVVGPVRDEDYYRLAIRYEAIELALNVLEGESLARGETSRRFSPSVYAAALDRTNSSGDVS
jgi:hypothetical protein